MDYKQFRRQFDVEIISYQKYHQDGDKIHQYNLIVTEKKSGRTDKYYSNIHSWGDAEPSKGVFNNIPKMGSNINTFIDKHKLKN